MPQKRRRFRQLTQKEHILRRPEMYIGSISAEHVLTWTFDLEARKMCYDRCFKSSGLLHIIDEIIVNAVDNVSNSKPNAPMTYIRMSLSDEGVISVENDGAGIPVIIHRATKHYVPDLIFGHWFTGANFDDTMQAVVAGRHGLGAKLTNVFSTSFAINCKCDGSSFKKQWRNNMGESLEPEVIHVDSLAGMKEAAKEETTARPPRESESPDNVGTQAAYAAHSAECATQPSEYLSGTENAVGSDGSLPKDIAKSDASSVVEDGTLQSKPQRGANATKVTFLPDYERFFSPKKEITKRNLLEGLKGLIAKRLVDVALYLPSILVSFNGCDLTVRSFREYASFFSSTSLEHVKVFTHEADKCLVGVVVGEVRRSARSFTTVSMVNGVSTPAGGSHVSAFQEQLLLALDAMERGLLKHDVVVKPSFVRTLTLVVSVRVHNPKFDSQTKSKLVSPHRFPKLKLDELVSFLSDAAMAISKHERELLDGNKESLTSSPLLMNDIPKLVDAIVLRNQSTLGRAASRHCTLIVTEGDSAKALALSSLSSQQRNTFGVFPLRGKVLNVRRVDRRKLEACTELMQLFKAIGLKPGTEYEDTHRLRYHSVVLMTDQDADGFHIRGLLLSAFEYLWPKLLRRGFLKLFHTPLLKATHRTTAEVHCFMSWEEFEEWKTKVAIQLYSIRYYKGLGTSTTEEGKEYFRHFARHVSELVVYDSDKELLDNVFNTDRAQWRKLWLQHFRPHETKPLAVSVKQSVFDFIHRELIGFAIHDNARSIPHAIDGLKPSQRKILWSCFRRKLMSPLRVTQLSGYVADVANFHSDEASLQSTIINLAQDFTGASNVNLLQPIGQFGTRLRGGSDHAAPRYLFTSLSPVARLLFPEEDDALLEYREEEGIRLEPAYYVPVVPLLLINGSIGIGFGFQTSIPPYHPLEVIRLVRSMISGQSLQDFICHLGDTLLPNAVGFRGTLSQKEKEKHMQIHGAYLVTAMTTTTVTLRVTELPWNISVECYRTTVVKALGESLIGFNDYCGSNHVDIDVIISRSDFEQWNERSEVAMRLGLISSLALNATVFSPRGELTELRRSFYSIVLWHYQARLDLYKKRLDWLREEKVKELRLLRSRYRFLSHLRASPSELLQMTPLRLEQLGQKLDLLRVNGNFRYLTARALATITHTGTAELEETLSQEEKRASLLSDMTPEELWRADLNRLEDAVAAMVQKKESAIQRELDRRLRTAHHGITVAKRSTKKLSAGDHENMEAAALGAVQKVPRAVRGKLGGCSSLYARARCVARRIK